MLPLRACSYSLAKPPRLAAPFALLLLLCSPAAIAQTWERVQGLTSAASVAFNDENPRTVWFGADAGQLFVSHDGGRTARPAAQIPPSGTLPSGIVTALFIHPTDTTFMLAGTTMGASLSRDGGQTWTAALPDRNVFLNGLSVAVEPGRPDTLYVALFSEGGCPELEQPSIVAGAAVDTQGLPLSGAVVTADNQTVPGSNAQGITGESGCYSIALPTFASTWAASATYARDYHGQTYRFDLHTDPAPFAGNDGAIRNFEWRLTGPRPDEGVYGSTVLLYVPIGGGILQSDVELTLEPAAPLVDGSAGAPVVARAVSAPDGWGVLDVALGRYAIRARYVPTGQPLEIRERNVGAYGPEVTLDFKAPFGSLPIYWIEVEVGEPLATDAGADASATGALSLSAPAPNPSSAKTRIHLTLDRAETVRVEAFDALGRRVAVLHDGPLAAGDHALAFDTAVLPVGTYVVRATGVGTAVTRRLTVIR